MTGINRWETSSHSDSLEEKGVIPSPDFQGEEATLSALIDFILEKHHAFTRNALHEIEGLVERSPKLKGLTECFFELKADLVPHLFKEENILFPFIRALESHHITGSPLPIACFSELSNPIHQMNHEHDKVKIIIKRLREITHEFIPPSDSLQALYSQLEGLEKDLLAHISLEERLFSRALMLDSQ